MAVRLYPCVKDGTRIQLLEYVPQVVERGDNVLALRLLQLLQWEPRSPAYLRTTLGIASREYFTKAYLRPLTEAGLIVRTDPDHPNSPRQKYALTKAGSEVQTIDRAVSRFLAARTREEGDSSPKDNIKELLRKYQTTLVNLIFGNISNIEKSNS